MKGIGVRAARLQPEPRVASEGNPEPRLADPAAPFLRPVDEENPRLEVLSPDRAEVPAVRGRVRPIAFDPVLVVVERPLPNPLTRHAP